MPQTKPVRKKRAAFSTINTICDNHRRKRSEGLISRIGQAIKLKNHPVAVFRTTDKPEGALQFKEGRRGCVISMLSAASKGRTAVFDINTTTCVGGKAGLGFKRYDLGYFEYFLSNGGVGNRKINY